VTVRSDEESEGIAPTAPGGGASTTPPGSTAEFDEWVRPHLDHMARLASRLGGVDARDDLVQDALTRAWRRRETFDPERGSPRTWLLAVVAGEAKRGWRRRPLPPPIFDDWRLGPDESAGQKIDIERAIAELPQRERLAVALHYFVDLRIDDCAEVMGCAPGTVKWLLHDARARLQPLLED
jgi:RNA polymerase sigma-70 factor (ECF subfamily)